MIGTAAMERITATIPIKGVTVIAMVQAGATFEVHLRPGIVNDLKLKARGGFG
jgi:hypothetical protein